MKNENLEQWLPCQSYCQMNGAAAAVLSFKNTTVVLNGPSWCSLVVERELMSCNRTLQHRLYCSHVEQADLLFGTGDRIREILDVQKQENPDTGLLAVLTSCSVGLIGDDVSGIVSTLERPYPAIALDTGGLTGLFEEGYQTAMTAIIDKVDLQKCAERHPRRVNLLGYCSYYPNSSGDLTELKRLLAKAGFEVGVCPGEQGLDLKELQNIPLAALNIVLAPELGLQTAKRLKEKTGQDYAVLPIPYGLKQTMGWVQKIGENLSVMPDLKKLEQEVCVVRENVGEEVDALKRMIANLTFKQAILALPYTQAKALADALQHEILEVENIIYQIQGNYMGEDGRQNHDNCGTLHPKAPDENDTWLPFDIRLLFGAFADRVRTGGYAHTIYFNMYKADGLLRRKYRTFAGIEGWGCLIHEIVEQTLTLYFIREERRPSL